MPNFSTADFTLSVFLSNSNSGVCRPTITNPLSEYLSYHSFRCGIVLIQLMQL